MHRATDAAAKAPPQPAILPDEYELYGDPRSLAHLLPPLESESEVGDEPCWGGVWRAGGVVWCWVEQLCCVHSGTQREMCRCLITYLLRCAMSLVRMPYVGSWGMCWRGARVPGLVHCILGATLRDCMDIEYP